jgi:hypothetical protein
VGCSAVAVASGARVTGRLVGEAGIWVGAMVAGWMVFVGKDAGLVGDATVTDMSHASDAIMSIERNKKAFFIIVNLLSCPIIAIRNEKLPCREESLHCPNG